MTTTPSPGSAKAPGGISPRVWLGLAIAAVAVVFIIQNRATVTIQLFTVQVASPQWLTLSVVFVLGLLAGFLIARRRR